MSTQITIKRLLPSEMMQCPVMNLWALSEVNELKFQPGNTVSECWVHQRLAAFLFEKTNLKTARNTILKAVRRHPLDSDLVLYGDLHRSQTEVEIEKTQT